jgi:TPR repeat protein
MRFFALALVAAAAALDLASLRASCSKGDDKACLALEESVAATREKQVATVVEEVARCGPSGCAPDAERPIAEVESSCLAGNANDCSTAALRHEDGTGVARSAERAHTFFRLACAQGRWFACNNLYLSHKDRLGALVSQQMFRRSCDRGDARACRDAADWAAMDAVSTGGIDALQTSWPKLKPLYQRACDGDDGAACRTLSQHADGKEKLRLLKKSCELDNPDSCAELK